LIKLDNIKFPTWCDNSMLTCPINKLEIKEVVSQCGSFKNRSSDGFNYYFLKNKWDIVWYDIVNTIQHFQQSSELPRGCNAPLSL